jgi:putative transposase
MGYVACSADLTKLKHDLPWLREVDSTALQSSLKDLDVAYQNFFRRVKVKKGGAPGFPRFKSKRKSRKSYKSKAANIKVLGNDIQLPKLGLIKCRVSKQIQGRILSATVSQNPSGKYFATVCCTDVEIEPLPKTGAAVGIDMGIHTLATLSDGTTYANHKFLEKSLFKLQRLQRKLSRKSKGSQNYRKARVKVARMHETIANQRNDAIHKATTDIIRKYDTIAVEKLSIASMVCATDIPNLPRRAYDASMGEFLRQIKYKAQWYGRSTITVAQDYPSSQTCSSCGFVGEVKLSQRAWTCPECGTRHDRDINAAKNILREGLRLIA